jgi:hypothetical protein
MNPEQQRLQRLLERARKGRPSQDRSDDPCPPPGFTTRIAARWAAPGKLRSGADAWELLARWGSAGAAVVCILTLVYQHQVGTPTTSLDLLLEVPATEIAF